MIFIILQDLRPSNATVIMCSMLMYTLCDTVNNNILFYPILIKLAVHRHVDHVVNISSLSEVTGRGDTDLFINH